MNCQVDLEDLESPSSLKKLKNLITDRKKEAEVRTTRRSKTSDANYIIKQSDF